MVTMKNTRTMTTTTPNMIMHSSKTPGTIMQNMTTPSTNTRGMFTAKRVMMNTTAIMIITPTW